MGLLLILAGVPALAQTVVPLPAGPYFAAPHGLAIDKAGNLFVLDTGNYGVIEIPASGNYVAATRLAPAGNFKAPMAIAIDGAGNLFVADTGNNAVKEIVAAGGYQMVRTVAGAGNFNAPAGIAVDAGGNVFVADTGNNAVKEVLAASGYTSVALLPAGGGFTAPYDIVVDGQGNLFVADGSTAPVKEVLAAGGYATATPLGAVGVAPTGLALDSAGNLYVSSTTSFATALVGQIAEYLAAGGYAQSQPIVAFPPFVTSPETGIAVDGSGNVFTTSWGTTGQGATVQEYVAADSYAETLPAISNRVFTPFNGPAGVVADAAGNVFVTAGTSDVWEVPAAGGYAEIEPLRVPAGTFDQVESIARDRGGNLFVVGEGGVKEVLAASGYTSVVTLPVTPPLYDNIAVDGAGNLFIADYATNAVAEIPAAGGYASIVPIAVANGNFNRPIAVAVDGGGNVFVTDTGNGVVKEILAEGGYVTVNTLPAGGGKLLYATGIAVDGSDNVFIANASEYIFTGPLPGIVQEISPADGYTALKTLAPDAGLLDAGMITLDPAGNLYVVDAGHDVVKKYLLAPSPLAAAVLPGSRAVEAGTPATVFVTLLNSGSTDLANCAIGLGGTAPGSLSVSYQTTDAATNKPTGTADTPVALPAGGSQSFLLGFLSASAAADPGQALNFGCDGVASAPVVPGVNTVDLDIAAAPTQDIITAAATAPQPGIVSVPIGGGGAFAIATFNAGIAGTLTASVDTGGATLPLSATLCPTDPATAQCLQPPEAAFQQSFAAAATPTFSIFLTASGPIDFLPATNRIFVRFKDAAGVTHGSTSVAVEAQ